MSEAVATIAVLGASGLIGQTLARRLAAQGFRVVPLARRFTASQAQGFKTVVQAPLVGLSAGELTQILAGCEADLVVNCIGVLQDSRSRGSAAQAHAGFVARLIEAMRSQSGPQLLVHVSIPGAPEKDRTTFSTSKREAERLIAASPLPSLILRPGFVIAPAAYGGSALIRALAALPFGLPAREGARSFAATDAEDLARTVAHAAARWQAGERDWKTGWDVMEQPASTVDGVIEGFRRHFGGPEKRRRLPSWLLSAGARAGDLAATLGWSPPVRSTALAEMRRGVQGDPSAWTEATGLRPASLSDALARLPATVQERWFARLYLLKPLMVGTLALFWIVSGLIALVVSFRAATAILTDHGVALPLAQAVTVVSSLMDIAVGLLIAARPTCRTGLIAGIGVSLFYMLAAALITPDMWIEPLGALVKTGPAIVLMLAALAILDER